jgi:hypothetical protein
MAAFSHISGAEPSTITFKAATVTQTRNSSVMHQELISLADPESSLAISAVLNAAPASTTFGLAVRRVGDKAETSAWAGGSVVPMGAHVQNNLSIVGDETIVMPKADINGVLWVTLNNAATNVVRDEATQVDDAVFVPAGNRVMMAGATFDDTAPDSVDEGDGGALRMSSNRALYTILRDAAGNERGANVTAAKQLSVWAQNSSAADLLVQASGNSTVFQGSSAWQVQVTNQARVTNSSAADFVVTVSGNSTVAPLAGSTWNTRPIQSSAADLQMTATPLAGSTWNVRALNSSAADLQATVTPAAGSTWTVRALNSSAADLLATVTLGTNLQSTLAPSSNSSGLIVRQVVDNILTTASTNTFTSTSFTIQSSGAALRSYVTAYSITTTNAGPTKVAFYSSAVMLWPVVLAAVSSAVSGVNLAVSAPGYLFRTIGAADALTLNIHGGGATAAGWHVGVSYFRAP